MSHFLKIFLFLVVFSFVLSCATTDHDSTKWSAKKLYVEAKKSLDKDDFIQAIEYFENLEAKYPFGLYTQQARLEISYAHYKHEEYEEAYDAIDYFIKLHPRHKNISYALYLKGLILFREGRGIMESVFPRDFSNIDSAYLLRTYRVFELVHTEHKFSIYAKDSLQRMIFLRNKLAQLEYKTAEYYQRRGAIVASINRLKYLLNIYPKSTWSNLALNMLAINYQALKMQKMNKISRNLSSETQ
ncbi:MAG: outer membrane protein assembly factor BamD [Gammaproteobacteria bacterium]|nr:MAG: outer membrane protein assembly factor BamD [Gammaproteobacteria bacterium]